MKIKSLKPSYKFEIYIKNICYKIQDKDKYKLENIEDEIMKLEKKLKPKINIEKSIIIVIIIFFILNTFIYFVF